MSPVNYPQMHGRTHRPGGSDPIPGATEPSTIYRLISAASTNADTIKASAGTVTGYYITNLATTFRYVKLYDKASAPTVGTDVPALTLGLPPVTAANIGLDNPLTFATGIAIALVTGIADSDATAVAANQLAVNIYYI